MADGRERTPDDAPGALRAKLGRPLALRAVSEDAQRTAQMPAQDQAVWATAVPVHPAPLVRRRGTRAYLPDWVPSVTVIRSLVAGVVGAPGFPATPKMAIAARPPAEPRADGSPGRAVESHPLGTPDVRTLAEQGVGVVGARVAESPVRLVSNATGDAVAVAARVAADVALGTGGRRWPSSGSTARRSRLRGYSCICVSSGGVRTTCDVGCFKTVDRACTSLVRTLGWSGGASPSAGGAAARVGRSRSPGTHSARTSS